MGRFDHYPPHVRHKIARIATAGVALLMAILLIVLYMNPSYRSGDTTAMSKLRSFYTTITDSAQSYFDTK